jgi:23S rRNA (guanosine2251-2'-O)-methyltransferase
LSEERIICGINALSSALESGSGIRTVLVARGRRSERIQKLIDASLKRGFPLEELERSELTRICDTDKHQGIAAYASLVPRADLGRVLEKTTPGKRLFLVLDEITDPHNFGALIRSAAAAGCCGVVYARDRSCSITPVVEKAAAGTLDAIPLCQVTNIARALATLKDAGVWAYGLALKDANSIYATDLSGDVALVVGSEGRGIRPGVLKACDATLKIPMPGRVESLNVSVAAGVALFEVLRQRG